MSTIYISYTGRDPDGDAWADRLAEWFAEWSYSYFRSKDHSHGVIAGSDWRQVLYRELGLAQVVVCLCSKQYENSPWCVAEAAIAVKDGKLIIPIKLAGTQKDLISLPLPLLLHDYQRIIVENAANPGAQQLAEVKQKLQSSLQANLKPRDLQFWDKKQAPFPGLPAFEEHQAPVFFGREREIVSVCERLSSLALRPEAFLLLLGAAGCGKTSLVRAGVIPQLKHNNWVVLPPFRPSRFPFNNLKRALVTVQDSLPNSLNIDAQENEEAGILSQLVCLGTLEKQPVLLVIDEIEELLMDGNDNHEAIRFLAFLESLLHNQRRSVIVLATMRTDFLSSLQTGNPELTRMASIYMLDPIDPKDFGVLISGPAMRTGLVLEPGLEERLVMESGGKDALPLLALTLEKLWHTRKYRGGATPGRRPGEKWDLTLEDYFLIGGIGGAVSALARDCWYPAISPAAETEALREAFVGHLVRVGDDGLVTKCPARLKDLPSSSRPILERMVKARLLVVDGERVEIAHEALLRTWEPLSQWIDEWYVGLETSRTDKSVLKSLPAEKEAPCKQEITQSGKDVKIVLLGRGGAGKTSLLKRLKGEAFNPNEPMTQGIQLSKFPFQAMDDTFRLNVWDFAGQESMHATHQFFLTKNTIYLLVLQGREGGEDAEAEYWLSYLEAFGDDSPVLVVLNKINECSFDLNYNSLLSRYRQCRDFVKTDCKENNGIDKLSSHLQSLISGMPSAQFYLRPPYWPRVKSRLEQMGKVLVATEEIYTLCSEEGVSAQDEIEELLNIFHLLGIILSYQDDAVLEGIVFLNPEWVANGIYAVLTSEFLAAKEGEIDMHDLRTVLSAQRFPLDTHQYVIRLMRKFGLCLPYYKDDIHLFPELLGKAEPDAAHGFEPVRCLNYEYHYGFLPHGLIPRFIVQSHILSCPQSRWRSGVVLTHLKCRALVIGDPTKRRVTVRVKNGQPSARRELLGIIRAYFKQVHFQFSRDRLDVQERVPLIGYPSVSVDPDKLSAFELKGIQTYPEYDGQIVFTVDVSELLNGIEPERRDHLSGRQSSRPKHIFISYSHKDERYRAQLETHLTHLKNLGIISFWHDRMILPSREWESEIDENLRNADIVIMLISPDFMASDYCMGKEVRYAMDRHHSSTAQILPILVRKCDYKDLAFGKIQGLPKNQRPVSSWKDKDSAWHDVCMGIRSVAEEKDAASER